MNSKKNSKKERKKQKLPQPKSSRKIDITEADISLYHLEDSVEANENALLDDPEVTRETKKIKKSVKTSTKKVLAEKPKIEKIHLETVHDVEEPPLSPLSPRKTHPLWRVLIILVFFGFTVGLGSFFTVLKVFGNNLPEVDQLNDISFSETSIIYDREGNILYEMYGDENRHYVELSQISPFLLQATVAMEDKRFYHHMGFDVNGIVRALLRNAQDESIQQGASTITQQLGRNIFLTREQTLDRKIRELLLAVEIEQFFTKDQILEMYLNKISYGNNAYGIQAAADIYFDKSAKDLNLIESAILASLPNNPTVYSPYGQNVKLVMGYCKTQEEMDQEPAPFNPEDDSTIASSPPEEGAEALPPPSEPPADGAPPSAEDTSEAAVENPPCSSPDDKRYVWGRKDYVLQRMILDEYITEEQMLEAWREGFNINFHQDPHLIKEPHFVFYVKDFLEQRYGKEMVQAGGLRVKTTLDPRLQEIAHKVLNEQAPTNLNRYRANNGALVALDPKTGQILSMVGSLDYWNQDIDGQVNVATSPRQPGSTFKPFVYAAAIQNGGIGSGTILSDYKTYFGAGRYSPNNSDNSFKGSITIRNAIGSSRNIPAIKAFYVAGEEDKLLDFVEKMGMSRLKTFKAEFNKDAEQRGWVFSYGPPLAIGSGEITLLELVGGYSTFANGGKYMPPTPILEITDREGNVIESFEDKGQQVMDPQTAFIINSILSDVYARPAGSWRAALTIPGKTMTAKTGTSNKKVGRANYPNNLWTAGYTPSLAAGVWIGNTDGSQASWNAWGEYTSAPVWKKFMQEALKDAPDEPFPVPEGIIQKGREYYPSFTTWTNYDKNFVKIVPKKDDKDKEKEEDKQPSSTTTQPKDPTDVPQPDWIKNTTKLSEPSPDLPPAPSTPPPDPPANPLPPTPATPPPTSTPAG